MQPDKLTQPHLDKLYDKGAICEQCLKPSYFTVENYRESNGDFYEEPYLEYELKSTCCGSDLFEVEMEDDTYTVKEFDISYKELCDILNHF